MFPECYKRYVYKYILITSSKPRTVDILITRDR